MGRPIRIGTTVANKSKPDKYVDPLYSRSAGFPPISNQAATGMPARTWGAGDPDYVKKMLASGKSKPIKAKK
jgi:hypothetical protein